MKRIFVYGTKIYFTYIQFGLDATIFFTRAAKLCIAEKAKHTNSLKLTQTKLLLNIAKRLSVDPTWIKLFSDVARFPLLFFSNKVVVF